MLKKGFTKHGKYWYHLAHQIWLFIYSIKKFFGVNTTRESYAFQRKKTYT